MSSKIGKRLRNIRKAAGMTRDELAATASGCSQDVEILETTDQIPPVTLVMKLCNALGVGTGTLPDGTETAGPATGCIPSSEAQYDEANLRYYMLAEKKYDRNMEPRIIEVGYVGQGERISLPYGGEEFLYILEGDVSLDYGKERYKLTKGDSIYYDSVVPHLLSSIGDGMKARVLAITYMPAY